MENFRKTTLPATMAGACAGLFVSFAALAPVVIFSRPTYHLPAVIGMVVALSSGLGAAGGFLALSRGKGVRVCFAYGGAAAVLCLGILFGAGWDPGRSLDESGMRKEYALKFPYGRPALSRDEDILAIERLVARYSRTRADTRAIMADLLWLKEKRRDDARRLSDVQQTLERIEKMKEKGAGSKVSPRSKFRIPRRNKNPIIIW